MQRFFGIAQDTSGNVIPSCSVRVSLAGSATLATLFSDNVYTPLANPFTSETDGAYQFYVRDGRYDIVLTKTGITFDDDDTADVLIADRLSIISPAQITANQNDYSPSNAVNTSIWRLTSDATRTITGIAAPTQTSGTIGTSLRLVNVGSFDILLADQSSSSVAANQIITGETTFLELRPTESVDLVYDGTSTKWRVLTERASRASFSLTKVVANGPVTTSNTEVDLINVSVPGNVLSSSQAIRMVAAATVDIASAAQTCTVRIRIGGTIVTSASVASNAGAGASALYVNGWIQANGSSTSQFAALSINGSAFASTPFGSASLGSITSIDTNVDQTLRLTWAVTNATSTLLLTPRNALAEIIR